MKPELYVDANCVIGEGPVWDERDGSLYFIDLLGNAIHRFNGELTSMSTGENIGCMVLREGGGLAAGLLSGWYFLDFPSGKKEFICDPEADNSNSRFNDGKADPAGRFWAGTMSRSLDTGYGEAGPDAALYCLDAGLKVKKMLSGVIQGNGLCWSKDTRKFYFIDTQRFCVQEFSYDIGKNELSHGRVAFEVPGSMGIPDGMTIDDEGNLWVALWGGSAVSKWDPRTGRLLEKVELPALNVTCCCFGGRNMDELFVTTASLNTDKQKYPQAGSVFKFNAGVKGALSYRFKG